MKITIGVTTYGRPDLVKIMSESLSLCSKIKSCNIRIYDDCSPYWNSSFLKKTFPFAKQIIRRSSNLGADENMRQMFLDFLDTGDDILLIADSDLIFRPDFIEKINNVFKDTDGILSIYNSAFHAPIKNVENRFLPMVEKKSVGAAGTALSRKNIESIVNNVSKSRSFDWDWCTHLRNSGKRILVSRDSLAQHIGLDGTNCNKYLPEYGLNFYPKNKFNEQIAIECLQKVIESKNSLIRAYRIFKPLRFPLISFRIIKNKIFGKSFY